MKPLFLLIGAVLFVYIGLTTLTYATPSFERAQPVSDNSSRLPRQTIEGRLFRQYAKVERSDGTYRQMFISDSSLGEFAKTGTLPNETFVVMETYYTPNAESTNFTKQKSGSRWLYGSFSPSSPSFAVRPDPSCQGCHNSATPDVGGTFTLPMLRAAVQSGTVKTATCNRSGRTPCDAAAYETFR
jgi:hypothetical protein